MNEFEQCFFDFRAQHLSIAIIANPFNTNICTSPQHLLDVVKSFKARVELGSQASQVPGCYNQGLTTIPWFDVTALI